MPVDSFTLWCLVDGDSIPFKVSASVDDYIAHLKKLIREEGKHGAFANVDAKDLVLWKLHNPEPVEPEDELGSRIKARGDDIQSFATKLGSTKKVQQIFLKPPCEDHIHIIVKLPPPGATISPSSFHKSNLVAHGKWAYPSIEKKWAVNEVLYSKDAERYYYADTTDQAANQSCLRHVIAGEFVMLTGARASGKSTRLRRLVEQLTENGFLCYFVTFESVDYMHDGPVFWKSFGKSLQLNHPDKKLPMESAIDFLWAFGALNWDAKIVLFLDEFSEICCAPDDVRSEILRTIRTIKSMPGDYAIHSFIFCGTFSLLDLSTNNNGIAPFNVSSNIIQNTYFTMLQTSELFLHFAQNRGIVIHQDVIKDIWNQSNGHPGMVCLCGRAISEMVHTLKDPETGTIYLASWLDYVTSGLHSSLYTYITFKSMVGSLLEESALSAVSLFRSRFSGFPDLVSLLGAEEQTFADFLTSEGVLLRPNIRLNEYWISAPLIDGLLRRYVIPRIFPDAPAVSPIRQTGGLCVLNVLIESIKCFDKDHLRQAATSSYKVSKMKVDGVRHALVPRESVYDTELMRILTNWLGKEAYLVTGQWHLRTDQNGHRYSDIVLKKPREPTVVLELLATGDADDVRARIEKTPGHRDLLHADQAWVVHFTCEDDYLDHAIWQSDDQLENGVNVVHFYHPLDVSDIFVAARWKNYNGEVQDNTQPRPLLDAKWVGGMVSDMIVDGG